MGLQPRRVFRLSATMALSLAAAYALRLQLPYLAPMFALLLTFQPAPPLGLKKLLVLIVAMPLMLSIGLLLIPLLVYYPFSAILLVALGVYGGFFLTVNKGKRIPGLILIIGFTLISAAGTVSSVLATLVIKSLVMGIVIVVLCQWVVYPWFPEDRHPAPAEPEKSLEQTNWIALRATLILMPAYILVLTNPGMYLPVILKSVTLGQQGSLVSVRRAGRELLGSTFLGGGFAIAFWVLLGLNTNLWMFFLWTLLFGMYFSSKIYGVISTAFSPSFWQHTALTMFILLGSAVMDSDNGSDVYAAFYTRMSLFIAVALYAWLTVYLAELWRDRRLRKRNPEGMASC